MTTQPFGARAVEPRFIGRVLGEVVDVDLNGGAGVA